MKRAQMEERDIYIYKQSRVLILKKQEETAFWNAHNGVNITIYPYYDNTEEGV